LGESAVEAARRGTREETGLEIHDLEFLCWQECVYDEQFWKPRHFIWIDPQKALAELNIDPYAAVSIRTYLSRIGIA
jgi:hypothetical protein